MTPSLLLRPSPRTLAPTHDLGFLRNCEPFRTVSNYKHILPPTGHYPESCMSNVALKQKAGNISKIQLWHYGQRGGTEEETLIETVALASAYLGHTQYRVSGVDASRTQFSGQDGLRLDVRDAELPPREQSRLERYRLERRAISGARAGNAEDTLRSVPACS